MTEKKIVVRIVRENEGDLGGKIIVLDANRVEENRTEGKKSAGNGHKCAHCEKTFGWPSKLKIHMRIHNGDKPFEVSLKYTINDYVLRSLNTKFQCYHCEKRFCTSGHLKVHGRIHSGERPSIQS